MAQPAHCNSKSHSLSVSCLLQAAMSRKLAVLQSSSSRSFGELLSQAQKTSIFWFLQAAQILPLLA